MIKVTALQTSSLTELDKNFYADSITYSFTHSYLPSGFIARLDRALKAR